jgi:hypothetical protein
MCGCDEEGGHCSDENEVVVVRAGSSLPGGERERDEDSTAESSPASPPSSDEERIPWPRDDRPTGPLVIWRGSMGHPPSERWEVRYVPEAVSGGVAALREALEKLTDSLTDEIMGTMNFYFGPGARVGVSREKVETFLRIQEARKSARAALSGCGVRDGSSGSWEEAVEAGARALSKLACRGDENFGPALWSEWLKRSEAVLRAAWPEGDDGPAGGDGKGNDNG